MVSVVLTLLRILGSKRFWLVRVDGFEGAGQALDELVVKDCLNEGFEVDEAVVDVLAVLTGFTLL